jgi:hypothetical protein
MRYTQPMNSTLSGIRRRVNAFATWLTDSLRTRGLGRTLQALLRYPKEVLFDRRFGIDTLGRESLDGHHVDHKNAAHANPYKGIYSHGFRAALQEFGVPTQGTFVDFGAGKGRAMVLALEQGFDSVVGIEFVAEWASAGDRTLAAYAQHTGRKLSARMIHGDAAEYEVQPDDSVFFMYNPFSEPVMREVLANVHQSLVEHPRDAWLIYANGSHELSELNPQFRRVATHQDPSVGAFTLYRPVVTTAAGQAGRKR